MQLSFTKMNGAGNDFVMLDNRAGTLALSGLQIARVCDRHRGVGADGILLVEPARDGADFRMRYYNADGGEAEMCGNGARCFARFARKISGHSADTISFETGAGVIAAECLNDSIRLLMSVPHSFRAPEPLTVNGRALEVGILNTGVPHAVCFVDDLDALNLLADGSAIRHHEAFAPQGTNANFVQALAPSQIAIRTYERGVEDETLACGTGVCAAALLHHLRTSDPSPVGVRVRGGEILSVGFARNGEQFSDVTLTGPADFVFDGEISL
jgi:diaminopimelate epimerase